MIYIVVYFVGLFFVYGFMEEVSPEDNEPIFIFWPIVIPALLLVGLGAFIGKMVK